MDKRATRTEEQETLELFSDRIDAATASCATGEKPNDTKISGRKRAHTESMDDNLPGKASRRAADKIDKAVSAAARRDREKKSE